MHELSRRDFLKLTAAAVAVSTGLELTDTVSKAYAAKAKLAPPVDLKTLAKKSQAEDGKVVVYVGSADLGTLLGDGFKKAYPWADPSLVVSSTGAIRTKILTEMNAKKGADVFTVAPSTPYIFIRAGAAAPVALVNDDNLKELKDKTGYRHAYAQNIMCLTQNVNLATYVPSDIFDLAKPVFKDQLAMDGPDNLAVSALFLASHRKAWGDKKWLQWLQGLKDNNMLLTSSATSTYQAVLIGQRGIGAGTIADVLSQPAGAPVKASFYQGAAPYVNTFMKTSYAENPHTADLFMNWVMSTAGQKIIDGTNRTPAVDIKGAKNSVSTIVPKKFPIAPYSAISGFVFNPVPYTDVWHKYWPA